MQTILILLSLLLPSVALGQNLPNGFNCEDLIDFANGKVSPNRKTSVLVRQPQPKDSFGAALLSYDIRLCRRLAAKEITVDQFNVLHAEKAQQLLRAKQQAIAEQRKLEQQQNIQNSQRALQNQQVATPNQAAVQTQRSEAARMQQGNPQNPPGAQNNSQALIQACGAKGLGVDFVTGNCVSPQGGQTNPHNLYPPFTAPLPQPNPNDLIARCGALGRGADFVTGRCM